MASDIGETIQPDDLAEKMFLQISEAVKKFPKRLYLMGVLASDDAGSHQYANWTRKTCEDIGIYFHLSRLSPEHVATYIQALNTNTSIHGIMVYYPIFGDERDDAIRRLVTHEKDVEGLNQLSESVVVPRQSHPGGTLVPCTPRAVASILQWLDVYDRTQVAGKQLQNREICIINRSEIVGLPLAQLLAREGARVYSVDISGVQLFYHDPWSSTGEVYQKDLPDWTLRYAVQRAQVIISAVPDPAFQVDTKWLQMGAICINVSSEKNFQPDVLQIASKFVPRVGIVTIAALLYNLLLCASYH